MNFLRERALKMTLITVILVGIAVIATHLVTAFLIPAEYKSESKVLIEGKSSDVIINNYREIVNSRTVLTKAIEETGVDTSVDKLVKKVSATAEKDANFLTISVLSDSSNNAMKLNKTITSEFVEAAQPLTMGGEKLKLRVFDTASMPADPVNKNYLKNDGIAAAVTLLVTLFVLYNAFLSDQTKKKALAGGETSANKKLIEKEVADEKITVNEGPMGETVTNVKPATETTDEVNAVKETADEKNEQGEDKETKKKRSKKKNKKLGKTANEATVPVVYEKKGKK